MVCEDDILNAFQLRRDLGLDDRYILHPTRDNMFIQIRWILNNCYFGESNSYSLDNHTVWMRLDQLVQVLHVREKLRKRAHSSTVRAEDSFSS